MNLLKKYFLFLSLLSITSASYASSIDIIIAMFVLNTKELGELNCIVKDATSSKNQDVENKINSAKNEIFHTIQNVPLFKKAMKKHPGESLVRAIVYDFKQDDQPASKLSTEINNTKYFVGLLIEHPHINTPWISFDERF